MRLLSVAAHSFRVKGYDATTTRELAATMGLQKASLYYYISDKAHLLYEICEVSLQHIHATVEAAIADVRHPREQVEQVILAHVRAMLEDRDMHATMLVELRALSGDRRTNIIALRDKYEALVRGVIARAQDANEIRRDITAHDLTLALLNLLNWTIFWYSPDGGRTPEQLADEFRRIYLFGATAK
jgi:AcrR family transcriptional regulator